MATLAIGKAIGLRMSPHVSRHISDLLKAIRSYLRMDVAFLTEFLGEERVFHSVESNTTLFGLRPGDCVPMKTGYCALVANGRLPALIPDTSALALSAAIPETRSVPIGAHLSVPIRLSDGSLFGTFCCFSHTPRLDLGQHDLELLLTFAGLIEKEVSALVESGRNQVEKAARVGASITRGDPQLVFQSIINLSDMRPTAVEALSRFTSEPSQPPNVWFDEANSVGMGLELELIAVRKALLQASRLPKPLAISVNLSPQSLLSDETYTVLCGFDPKRIIIEITEHAVVENYEPIAQALAPLRNLGMRVAVDDVGAGYSSMRHALDLAPDILKFDVSFTRGIDADLRRRAMIAALSEYARRTSAHVVAEGVETIKELTVLVELGVEMAQGFFISRPKGMTEFLAELHNASAIDQRQERLLRTS